MKLIQARRTAKGASAGSECGPSRKCVARETCLCVFVRLYLKGEETVKLNSRRTQENVMFFGGATHLGTIARLKLQR